MKKPCKNQPCRRGSAPYRRSDWTSHLWGMSKSEQFKTTRESARSLSSLDSLELCGTRRSYAARFRGCALQRAPVRWTLTSEPTIGGGLRLCQSRNGAMNSTIAEESFPDDVTQREPAEFPEQRAELTTWHPKQRTELTRENETKPTHPACFKPTESK